MFLLILFLHIILLFYLTLFNPIDIPNSPFLPLPPLPSPYLPSLILPSLPPPTSPSAVHPIDIPP